MLRRIPAVVRSSRCVRQSRCLLHHGPSGRDESSPVEPLRVALRCTTGAEPAPGGCRSIAGNSDRGRSTVALPNCMLRASLQAMQPRHCSISSLAYEIPMTSQACISVDGSNADAAALQHVQRLLAADIREALDFYRIPASQHAAAASEAADGAESGPRLGLLVPPSPLMISAICAAHEVGAVAVPLPFEDAAVAVQTAAAAEAERGIAAATGSTALRSILAAVPEAAGREYVTHAITCPSRVMTSSKPLRDLEQALAESRVQLLLVHPALAAAAALLCQRLSIHICIVGGSTASAATAALERPAHGAGQQPKHDSDQVRLFVPSPRRITGGNTIRSRWVLISEAGRGRQELGNGSAILGTAAVNPTGGSNKRTDCSSNSASRSNAAALHVPILRSWGVRRAAVFSAAALQQQLQRNRELLRLQPGDLVLIGAAASAVIQPKLLLAAVLPSLQQQATVRVVTRQEVLPLPVPAQVAIEQQPKVKALKVAAAAAPLARAVAVWQALADSQLQQATVVLDSETAEAMLDVYGRIEASAMGADAADATDTVQAPAAEDLPFVPGDLAAAACRIRSCCICTDESDILRLGIDNDTTSSSSISGQIEEATPPSRPLWLHSLFAKWRNLLDGSASVMHLMSLSEVGTVSMMQHPSPTSQASEQGAAPAADAVDGVLLGQLLPGVSAVATEDGQLVVKSRSLSLGYFGRPAATKDAFPEQGRAFCTALLGTVSPEGGLRVRCCTYSAEPVQQRPLMQRLQQWQWGLPKMAHHIEGYVRKVPITGKIWGNYHARKRHWKRKV